MARLGRPDPLSLLLRIWNCLECSEPTLWFCRGETGTARRNYLSPFLLKSRGEGDAIGEGAVQRLHLGVGGSVDLEEGGEVRSLKIVAIYRADGQNLGHA